MENIEVISPNFIKTIVLNLNATYYGVIQTVRLIVPFTLKLNQFTHIAVQH